LDYAIDPDKYLDEIKKFVEEKTKIPTEKQGYFIGERLLNDRAKLIHQQVWEKDADTRLDFKPHLKVRYLEETFEWYPELRNYGSDLKDKILYDKKMFSKRSKFSVLNQEGKLLDEDKTLEQNGIQYNES